MDRNYELQLRIREFCLNYCPLKKKGRKAKKSATSNYDLADKCPHKKCPLYEYRR